MRRRDLCLGLAATATLPLPAHAAKRASRTRPGADDVSRLALADASKAIQRGELSCVDLTRACLARIDADNGRINAVITTMRDDALAQASSLDAEARAGRFRSALHGIPIALKDNIDTAGTRTTNASALHKDRIPTEDARVVQQLKQAGAIIIAKANLSEFALASATSASSHFGPVRNPWNVDLVSGGSSGGSAAAVASGMCVGALGTDSGGSVRIPSAWCGLTGLKPTLGQVSFTGVGPTPLLLDTIGPIARTAADVALLFDHLTGYDPRYLMSPDRPRENYSAAIGRSVSHLRVGVQRRPFFEGLDDQVASAVEAAIAVIARLTGGVRDVVLKTGDMPDLFAMLADITAYHGELVANPASPYQPAIRKALQDTAKEVGEQRSAPGAPDAVTRYIRSQYAMLRRQRTIDEAFDGFDVLVMPTLKLLPPTVKAALESEYGSGPPMHGAIVANTMLFNVLGLPALTVPCGFSASGLPIGLEICGPRFSEATLLALGAAYQQATSWHERRPA